MKTVKVYMNHGRWIVDCPKHGNAGAMEVKEGEKEYIAPCCYPNVLASFPVMRDGQIKMIADISARATAKRLAIKNDDVYEIVFPEKLEEIKAIMEKRLMSNRNWTTETLAALKKENKVHGVK